MNSTDLIAVVGVITLFPELVELPVPAVKEVEVMHSFLGGWSQGARPWPGRL
ncbi:hypothetical protein ACWFMI_27435 [Nocardiopsis terrae]